VIYVPTPYKQIQQQKKSMNSSFHIKLDNITYSHSIVYWVNSSIQKEIWSICYHDVYQSYYANFIVKWTKQLMHAETHNSNYVRNNIAQ